MDFKGNFLKILCLSTSTLGLFLIYLAARNVQPQRIELEEINSQLIGKSVTVEGKIVYKKYHPAGHLFLSLSDGKQVIQVPIFSSLMEELTKKGFSVEDFSQDRKIKVTGLIGEYNGQLQIVPRKVEDISLG